MASSSPRVRSVIACNASWCTTLHCALKKPMTVTSKAPSGTAAALQHMKLAGTPVALLLVDQRMPEMQGDEFLAKARNVSDAEAILLTGYADLKAVIGAVNKGRIMAYEIMVANSGIRNVVRQGKLEQLKDESADVKEAVAKALETYDSVMVRRDLEASRETCESHVEDGRSAPTP